MRTRRKDAEGTRTVVHALADRLEHLEVDDDRAAVVPVVLGLLVAVDARGALRGGERERRLARDARDDAARVEAQDRRVRVDFVRVEDRGLRVHLEDRRRQRGGVREWVLFWAGAGGQHRAAALVGV